jgi:MinD-like ATPase involved in chromosome partitioning or flagellar assembly
MSSAQILSPPRGLPGVSQVDALLGRGPRQSAAHGSAARGATTLLMASGRGGSGTSLVSLLFAVAAAGDGRRVLLVDADDFVGPLALTLGLHVRASWRDLRGGRLAPAEVATPVSTTLTLVAGGAPRLGTDALALTAAERRACLRRLAVLADGMDLVVIDCGARLDTVLAAITPHADERLVAIAAGSDPVGLASTYALCKAVHARHAALPMDVLVNRHEGSDAARCFDTIDAGARQFLGVPLRLAGAVPDDPTLDAALRAGMPFSHAAAGSPAANAAHDVVMRALTTAALSRSGT